MFFWIKLLPALFLFALLFYRYRMHVAAYFTALPMPRYRVRMQRDVIIPMRDGVRLVADVYFPKAEGKFPVIVTRTPYEKGAKDHQYPFLGNLFASQGYVCIIQDTRGKHQSEGDFYPFAHEESDGCDTVDWACKQEWSDGRVGTFGASYLGLTQWLSAPSQGEHLKAMVPIFISQRAYDIVRGKHGVLHFKDSLVWHYRNQHRNKVQNDEVNWEEAIKHLPVNRADEAIGGRIPCFRDWITHSELDGYWGQWRTDKKVAHIHSPALVVAGWFDRFIDFSIEDYLRMRREGSGDARESRLLIGPWAHEPGQTFPDLKISKEASPWRQLTHIMRWFDRWVKGRSNGLDQEPPIRYFVLGENRWRETSHWPLKESDFQRFYLHGDATLQKKNPERHRLQSTFLYDPENPVPSVGSNAIYAEGECGPRLQTEVEERSDVLVFTTAPMEEDFLVVGPVKLILYAASSAVDTDFTAKICDVHLDGRSVSLKGGIVRARYRHSLREPELLTPGKPEQFEIEIGAIANMFKRGHSIRLQVSSSSFPEYSRNLNVEEEPHHAKKGVVAQQTIYHDEEHPSYLQLPVIK